MSCLEVIPLDSFLVFISILWLHCEKQKGDFIWELNSLGHAPPVIYKSGLENNMYLQ